MWRVKAAAHVENDHKWAERDAKAVASHKKLPHRKKSCHIAPKVGDVKKYNKGILCNTTHKNSPYCKSPLIIISPSCNKPRSIDISYKDRS